MFYLSFCKPMVLDSSVGRAAGVFNLAFNKTKGTQLNTLLKVYCLLLFPICSVFYYYKLM